MNWAYSSDAAARAGAFFRTRGNVVPVPQGSLALDDSVKHERSGRTVAARVWFQHASADASLREMKIQTDQFGAVLTLLRLPKMLAV